jgi:hypothetical protein
VLALLLLALAGAGRARAAPTAPTPLSPANGADVRIPFQLSWSTAQDPSGVFAYNWQVSATSTFAKILRADSTMGELQDTVSGLAVGTYFWRVQGVSNDFVQGAWSATRSFRIIGAEPSLPATPTLNQPRGGNSFHPWESFGMSWSSVPGATKYILEASKDSAFPSSGVVFSWEQETPSTTILITTVDRGSYSARVFAVNADGITSMPSNVISFSIRFDAPIAAPPTLVSPTGGVTASLPITFTWNHVINPQSSGYHLQISRSSSFSTIDADIPFLNGPTYTVINLPGVGNHFWRVRSFQGVIDTAGTAAATAWSATGTFVLPDAPVRVSSFTLSRPAPAAGQEVYVDLQLNRAVPASGGTINMSSSNPSVAPLPASVPVQGSTSWVQFRFWTGQVDTPTSVTMTATIGSQSSTHTFTVSPSSLKGLEGFPVRRTSGTGFGGYVVLNGQAPPGGAVVSLSSSSSLAVPPATVTVPAGVEATGVTIPTSNVDQDTPVTITATWKGVSVQATTTLTPQPKPTSLTLDPTTTSSTSGSWGRVTAEGLTEDATFSLASSHPDIALVPSEVSVPQFGAAGGFIISTRAVSTTTLVTISVSGGGVTLTATLTLEPVPSSPPGSALSTLSLSPPDVNGGSSSTGVVTVNPSAPAGGIVVSLSSSNTAAATVPASVTIPGGGFSASFPVSTTASAATRTSTITGSAGGTTLTATLTVYGPMPSSLSLDPATVTGGAGSTATVTMTQAAPSGGVVLSLSSSDTTVATVPASVTVAAGATTASFAIATTTGTTQRFAHIGATANGTTKALTLTVDPSGAPPPPPPAPTPSALSLNPASVTGGTSSTGTVTLSAAAPSGGVAVALSSSNTAAATVPASVTVPAGATSANFSISTLTASTTRSSLITATAGGVSQTATLTVNASAATTDTVTISRAEFSGGRLRVEATSSGSGATLKAYVTSTGVLLGTLSGGRLEVNIASNPGNVTVKSSLGGEASRAVTG